MISSGLVLSAKASAATYEGLLLPAERNKTLTALANTEPVVGAQNSRAQSSLQWFLSESRWEPRIVNERRLRLLLEEPKTAPTDSGALLIDETGDRKDGKKTAHVGKQYLGGIGKIDNGMVSVGSLWAYTSGCTTRSKSSPIPRRATLRRARPTPASAPS